MDRLVKVILGLLLVTSTIVQLVEGFFGTYGHRDPFHPSSDEFGDSLADRYHKAYRRETIEFQYLKPRKALLKYLQHNKTLPIHYGVIDWDEVRKIVHSTPQSEKNAKIRYVQLKPITEENKKKYKEVLKKLEKALRNHCDPFLLRSKEKNITENIYNLNDPVNAWNMYLDYGLKGPVKITKSDIGTGISILEDPLVLLKGILRRHSEIPTLENGFIDWKQVLRLSDDDAWYYHMQHIPPNKRPAWIDY